jgi:hypothetical protein
MLGDLHRQKVDAETNAIQLQEQISMLRQQLGASSDTDGPSREQHSPQAQGGASLDASGDLTASAHEARRDLESMDSELDNFIRLRSYILHMQEGASLLLWKENGLQLCWFWLDKDCLSLNWDVDESPADLGAEDSEESGGGGGGGGGGGSLLLERIVDIVPLGAGADQLTDAPTDSSFTVQLRDSRLDIVAPTSLDFQVCVARLERHRLASVLACLRGLHRSGCRSGTLGLPLRRGCA